MLAGSQEPPWRGTLSFSVTQSDSSSGSLTIAPGVCGT